MTAHRVRWFVRLSGGEWIPHESTMRGLWHYDARCSCGWESRTGGGTQRAVAEKVADHKWDAAREAQAV